MPFVDRNTTISCEGMKWCTTHTPDAKSALRSSSVPLITSASNIWSTIKYTPGREVRSRYWSDSLWKVELVTAASDLAKWRGTVRYLTAPHSFLERDCSKCLIPIASIFATYVDSYVSLILETIHLNVRAVVIKPKYLRFGCPTPANFSSKSSCRCQSPPELS